MGSLSKNFLDLSLCPESPACTEQPYMVAATQKSVPSVTRFFYLAIPTLTILAGKAFIADNKI